MTPDRARFVAAAVGGDVLASRHLPAVGRIAAALGFHMRWTTPFSPGDQHHLGLTPWGVTGWNGRPDHQFSSRNLDDVCRQAAQWLAEYEDQAG